MLSLLLSLVLSAKKHTIERGYRRFFLKADTTFVLKIGYDYQAFVFGNNGFLRNSILRLITGTSYQDIKGIDLPSSAAAISADRAEIYFTANSPCDVEIWIIRADICPRRALFVDASGDFTIGADVPSPTDFCVFPMLSAGKKLRYGFPSSRGYAEIRGEDDKWECRDRVCEARVKVPYYVVVQRARDMVTFQARDSGSIGKTCEKEWFTYVDIARIENPSLPEWQVALTCPIPTQRATRRPRATEYPWMDFFLRWL
jgi:hypothetical protein